MSESIDFSKLEQLARAATPGPWKWHESYGSMALYKDSGVKPVIGDAVLFAEPIGCENSSVVIDDPDAAYIAAVSPNVVLALIERLRKAERNPAHFEQQETAVQDVDAKGVKR